MEPDTVERRLTTILSADVVEYSRLMGNDEARTLASLKTHRKELIEPKLAQYGGRTVKLMGDGALMEFGSVVDALLFSIDVQCLMEDWNENVPADERIIYRIGINIGDIIVDDDDIYGDGVNVAARLEKLSEPGGICVRRNVRNQVRGKVDIDFKDLGEVEVKNIEQPVRAFKVILDDKAQALRSEVTDVSAITGRSRRPLYIAAAVASLMVAAGALWWQSQGPQVAPASASRMALPLPDNPSIAVLPFDNLSGSAEQTYFADGMTEDLITDLSKVPNLFVIARNSTFTYKNKPVKVQKVAEDLGVRYVLEGSVRRAGESVRINAQLIDALTGYHIWADRYDGTLANVFGFQDNVVGQIVSALALNIPSARAGEVNSAETTSAEAYDAFLEGWQHYRQQSVDDTIASIRLFKRALEIDPDYSRAYAALAATYWRIADKDWSFHADILWQEAFDNARQYLSSALIQPTSTAYLVSAGILQFEGRAEDAVAEIEKAIALEPNNPDSYVSKAQVLIFLGKPMEAEASARLAMRMNPHYGPQYLSALGRALFFQGRYKEAAKIQERVANRQPDSGSSFLRLAATYAHLDRIQEAKLAVEKYDEIAARTGYSSLTVQETMLWYENTDNFSNKTTPEPLFEGLRKAGVPEGAAPKREGFDFQALVKSTRGKHGRAYVVSGVGTVDAEVVKRMLASGAKVIDVRDGGSFGRGHIPGAINLDLNLKLTEERLLEIVKKNEPVIFHCWGRSCSYSAMACAKARLWGFEEVHYFAGGFPEWKGKGFEVVESADSG